jgi:two-component system NarL family sensor kinase
MAVGASIVPVKRVPRVDAGRIGLAGLVVLLLLAALAFEAYRITTPSDGTHIGGSGNPFATVGVTIEGSSASALASPVQAGDRVMWMLGRSVEEWGSLLVDPSATRPVINSGDPIAYTLDRGGQTIELMVAAQPFDPIGALAEEWGVLVLSLTMQVTGVYLFARRPDEPAAQALAVVGTGMFASTVPWALGQQVTDIATASGFWLYALTAGVAYALFWCGSLHLGLVFPRPHPFIQGRGRLITVAYAVPLGAQLALILGAGLTSGRILTAVSAWVFGQTVIQVVVVVATVALMAHSYFRLVDPVGRLQLRWVAAAAGLAGVSALLLWFGPELITGRPFLPRSAVALLALPFPIALAMAINSHHLFNLDRIVNRSLVYGGLTVGVLVTYAATVAVVGSLIPGNAPYAVALLGAGAVALAALPLRDRMQRQVNRLMYGDRDEPDRALRRLGGRLERSLDPQTVLPTLVEAVAEAMRAPYVAIELERDGEPRVEASHGSAPIDPGGARDPARLPIVYRGQTIGRLVVVPRGAEEPFSRADERLLADLARQAGPAVEAVRLTADLRRSREELVATREEERRQLRRDLHDELGPALAGSLMKLGAARSMMESEPGRAGELLADLETDARGMIEEIRRIARDLRPPALDELGLVGVLRQRIATFDGGPDDRRLRVTFDAPESLPPLPAAVEVAALRIALEGLTNAARHSQASCARVFVGIEDVSLVVSVTDDGVGIAAEARPGVGLASMRERADEVGGSLAVSTPDGGGTTILARLPIVIAGPA